MREEPAAISWTPDLSGSSGPIYLALAAAIQSDIQIGALNPGDRLPTHRALAATLGLDLTTVTRAYGEARRRGLIDAAVGRGTFVRDVGRGRRDAEVAPVEVDLSMNLPPLPAASDIPTLLSRTLATVLRRGDAAQMLNYHPSGGGADDRAAAVQWLTPLLGDLPPSRALVAAGGQAILTALLTTLAPAGSVILTEAFTYPGLRAVAAQLGLTLEGLPLDGQGLIPEALDAACARFSPTALYTIPTIQNPTTATMSPERRDAVATVARRHGLTVIEDDAYGMSPTVPPPPIATLIPELTWYIGTVSKSLLPALRVAYLVAPDERRATRMRAALRAVSQMAPPLSAAVVARWIRDGTAHRILDEIRREAAARQSLAAAVLPAGTFAAHPQGHHLWLSLPQGWSATAFATQARRFGLALVPDSAFAVAPATAPNPAVRLSLGAARDIDHLAPALERIASLMDEDADVPPEIV
ncbi:GntR family transcriptional regulator [Skermanella stibiiresistens SB22]|uniref:GntR family transcriptional regulator n=1 Tax=Skermanella stibiiresistens SB22 TaxID=1385369 RepID=W9H073_9PROT|nr:PLP-dependent aminotransferase family protein [Skermanella stibiiresistens]EWY39590.1 GntR family transcriptional regulator [Skermanella stibiiresistens SB22]